MSRAVFKIILHLKYFVCGLWVYDSEFPRHESSEWI